MDVGTQEVGLIALPLSHTCQAATYLSKEGTPLSAELGADRLPAALDGQIP
jgi:hypothetical protein